MLVKTAGQKYAKALFEIAVAKKNVDEFKKALNLIAREFSDGLIRLFKSPDAPVKDKESVINTLAGGKVPAEINKFLFILLEKKRIIYFKEIAEAFSALADAYIGLGKAEVVTALPLPAAQRERLLAALEKKRNMKFDITYAVSPNLLGGIIIKIGNEVYDGSIRNSLSLIQNRILK